MSNLEEILHEKLLEKQIEVFELQDKNNRLNNIIEEIDEKDKEIERLNNKYNKALELLADYNLPCEYDEGKIPDNYCEENCSDDYKKCWNKYIELELKGDSSNE